MMEALVCHPLGTSLPLHSLPKSQIPVLMNYHRHNKSAHATLPPCARTRLKETRLHRNRLRDREARDTTRSLQRSRRCCDWYRAEDGDSLYQFRGV